MKTRRCIIYQGMRTWGKHTYVTILAADYASGLFRSLIFFLLSFSIPRMGSVSSVSKNLRSYYTKHFGPLNSKFVIANHTFIALDAPGLVDEDYQRHASRVNFSDWEPIPDGPVSFVKGASECNSVVYHINFM
jgi:hypothetical protein